MKHKCNNIYIYTIMYTVLGIMHTIIHSLPENNKIRSLSWWCCSTTPTLITSSAAKIFISDILQESVPGPLFFLLFIIDFPGCVQSSIFRLLADDRILCQQITSHLEHICLLAKMSVLDTEVDSSNPGSSMLFP